MSAVQTLAKPVIMVSGGQELDNKVERIHFQAKGRVHRRMAAFGRADRLTVQATMLSLRLRDRSGKPVHDPASLPHLGVLQGRVRLG